LEEPGERTHVVSDFVYQAVTKGSIDMMTTGEEVRQFIHIDDLCNAVHLVISDNLNRHIYDITSFEWISIIEIAEIIASLTGAKINRGKIIGNTPITPLRGKVPNWFPRVDIQNGLKIMVDELKEKLKGSL
jgi:nucleoside-diphosphate-sugar epimerase